MRGIFHLHLIFHFYIVKCSCHHFWCLFPAISELTCSSRSTQERNSRSGAFERKRERERGGEGATEEDEWRHLISTNHVWSRNEEPGGASYFLSIQMCARYLLWYVLWWGDERDFVELSIIASDKGFKQTQWVKWWERIVFSYPSQWIQSRRGNITISSSQKRLLNLLSLLPSFGLNYALFSRRALQFLC